MDKLLAVAGGILVSGIVTTLTLFLIRHVGPLQRAAGLKPVERQFDPAPRIFQE